MAGLTTTGTALDTHVHVHVPAEAGNRATLALLHGTGGDERQLIELGRMIAPGAGLLGIRGNVREDGVVTRWWRRLSEGVFDEADLIARTDQLGTFLDAAIEVYELDPTMLVPVGFSNGANTGAALLLRRPDLVRGGVFVSSVLPFTPEVTPELSHAGVLMVQGRVDPFAPADRAELLAGLLAEAGASVEVWWHDDGHALGSAQAAAARRWLTAFLHGIGGAPGATPPQ